MMDCSKDFNKENSGPEQHHAGTDDGQNKMIPKVEKHINNHMLM
jgi:hypothetical protein